VEPNNLRFGGGVSQTVLNPFILIAILIAGVLICVLPRNKAIVPFLAAAILIPMDQVLLVGSLHFPMLRLLILFGIGRMVWAKTSSKCTVFAGGINKIDALVILLATFTAVNGALLFREWAAVVKQMADLYTVCGVYFLMRFLIRAEEDVTRTLRAFAYIAVIVAMIMTYEQATGHNPYALLGGARALTYADIMERENHFRATASFGHPILAGTFGAIVLPLFVGLWWTNRKNHKIAVMGILAATVITFASGSSTPILSYAAGIIGLCLWPARRWMRAIRWSMVLLLISLHMVMKAPVWQLVARVDVVGGSSGDHRYQLINQCILHFWDWWLIGVKDPGVFGWGMWDTCNQFVAVGEYSGLLPFLFFVAIIVYGFKLLGRARRGARGSRGVKLFLWALGSALFANVVSFLGISYFDQTMVAWYGLLAVVSTAVTFSYKTAAAQPQTEAAVDSADTPLAYSFAP
jgi:hypothetical protein